MTNEQLEQVKEQEKITERLLNALGSAQAQLGVTALLFERAQKELEELRKSYDHS